MVAPPGPTRVSNETLTPEVAEPGDSSTRLKATVSFRAPKSDTPAPSQTPLRTASGAFVARRSLRTTLS